MKKHLVALMLGGLGIGTTEFVMMGLLEDISANLHISIPTAGNLISAYALGVVIGAPLLVLFAGNIAPKKLLILLMGLFTGFNALSAFAINYDFLLLSRLFAGLPHGAFFGVGAVVASRLAEKGKEAREVAVMFAGLSIANIAGVPLGTYIGHTFNWRYPFVLIALIGLITVLAIYFWMPTIPKAEKQSLKGNVAFLKTRETWLLILTIAIGTGGLFCWISYIGPLLTKVTHFNEDSVSTILILAGFGMLAGNWLGARLADRFSASKTAIGVLLTMCATLFFVYLVSENQTLTLFSTFLTGAVAFALIAPVQVLVIHTAKGSEMLAAAVSQAAFNIGNALGAFLGGIPLKMGYNYNTPEFVGILMALTGVITAWMFAQRMKKQAIISQNSVE